MNGSTARRATPGTASGSSADGAREQGAQGTVRQATSQWGVRRRTRVAAVVVGSVMVVDQLTKAAVVAAWKLGDGVDLVGRLRLVHAVNTGIAFSLGRGSSGIVVPIVVLIVGLAWVVRRELARPSEDPDAPTRLAVVAFGLIVGGAFGNLVDRLVRGPGWGRGGVVDFIDVQVWPVFNIADSALSVGVVLMMVNLVRLSRASAPVTP